MSLSLKGRFAPTGGFELKVDLELPSSGVTSVIGVSGSGKSTLLRLIAGLNRSPGFQVMMDGRDWSALPAHRRPISMTLQQPALFPHLTVAGNLRAVPDGSRFDEAVSRFGLEDLLERKPAALSGGQQQRAALARAYLKPAALWLLDEPLSALDAMARARLAPMLGELCRTLGKPVIYVTHALSEVVQIADHLVILEAGRVIGAGPPGKVAAELDHPLSPMIDTGAILAVEFDAYDEAHDLSALRIGNQTLRVRGNLSPAPSPLRVQIPARDVALALEPPLGTSILNCLAVTLTSLDPTPDGAVFAELDCGGQALRARITRLSSDSLELVPGMALHALIKSVALDVRGDWAQRPKPATTNY
ncbi:MAG: molybdenum ABC transporter ATP-binding protein [Gammaproteobacteria bacterium]|nr:molybdenum ABC transporter ATP-binding protein [Gammaproteobacteria bacterium]